MILNQNKMKKCTGCDRLDNMPLGLNDKGNKYLACCPDNNYIEMTIVEWLESEYEKLLNWHIPFELLEQAKEKEKQEKLKVQIEENESVLEMLRFHGNDSSIIRVFSRLESLKEQLKEMEL